MDKLKIAIQKSGRLSENSKKLLEECGIKFPNGISVLKTTARNFPVEVLFLRDDLKGLRPFMLKWFLFSIDTKVERME